MRKIFVAFIALTLLNICSYGQAAYAGLWEGKLKVGLEVRVIFKIARDSSNNFTATMDIPDQGMNDNKVVAKLVNDSLRLEVTAFNSAYTGKLINDSTISGRYEQGLSFPLELKKITHVTFKVRAQTPKPPFPYKSEDITYTNKDHSITYGATITIPEGKGPFPAALLLTGSGQQNRDEEIGGHKPFAVIADHLTRNGFIVLRADDRGVGKTTGDVKSATTRDFANDAVAGIQYLLSRKETDRKNIGLIGHSEGGMIAQMIGAERSDIKFIILLAGPGIKTFDLLVEQNAANLAKVGISKDYIEKYAPMYQTMLRSVMNYDSARFDNDFPKAVDKWVSETPANAVMITTGITDEASKKKFVDAIRNLATNKWFRYFLNYDPAVNLKSLKAHVLALNGERDIQVLSKSNLQGIEAALKQGKAKSFEIKEIDGLNHLFQKCISCNVFEYTNLPQTFSPEALEIMTAWLKKVAK